MVPTHKIIAIFPTELQTDPKWGDLPESPVTTEHSLIQCPRCDRDCWIGPKQRVMATLGGGEALCVFCIFSDPGLKEQATWPIVAINPRIDEVPRRFPRGGSGD